MSVHPSPKNLARDVVRQVWPKRQPRRPKPRPGFSEAVRQDISRRSAGMCELDFCGPADHYHHRAPRGRGGSSLEWVNLPANGLHVALACHDRIERNRAAAYENGWLVRRNGQLTAAEVKVRLCGHWVLLDNDGGARVIGGES